jgi:hypothetical protein
VITRVPWRPKKFNVINRIRIHHAQTIALKCTLNGARHLVKRGQIAQFDYFAVVFAQEESVTTPGNVAVHGASIIKLKRHAGAVHEGPNVGNFNTI